MSTPFHLTSKTYLEHLQAELSPFGELPFLSQLALAGLFKKTLLTDTYQHKNGEGIFYPAEILQKTFGRNYAQIMQQFFMVDSRYRFGSTDPADNYTMQYILKTEIRELVNNYLLERTTTPDEIYVNEKLFRNGNAITRNDMNGKRKKSTVKLPNITPVNTQNIHDLSVYLSKQYDRYIDGLKHLKGNFDIQGDDKRLEYLIRIVNELIRLSNVKPVPFGYMPSIYRETSTGRLQGQGVHLQNIPRIIRAEAVRGLGYYNYDFSNCHYSALEQMCSFELPTVKQYNEHKNDFRSAISDDVGVSIRDVKDGLISIIYGATPKTDEGLTMDKIFKDRAEMFLKNEIVSGLFDDIAKARTDIIKNADRSRYGIVNLQKKTIDPDERDETILAHILQGVEAAMLQSALSVKPESVKILLFDGWISNEKLNVSEVKNRVLRDTGFNVNIDEKKLP